MMKDAIHGHNFVAPGLYFLTPSLLCASSGFPTASILLEPSFAWLFIEKGKKVPDKLVQASCTHPRELLA